MPWWGYEPWCSRGLEPGNARAASLAPTSWLSCRLSLGAGAVGAGAQQPWAAPPRNCPGPSVSCFSTGGAKQPQIPLQMSSCTGSSTSQLWWTLQCRSIHSHLSATTTSLPHGELPSGGTHHGDMAPQDLCRPSHLGYTNPAAATGQLWGRQADAHCPPLPPCRHFQDTKRYRDTRELLSSLSPAW